MNREILHFENIYKIFKGTVDTVALDNLSYSFEKNKITAIYGPSGSGKSTLLKLAGAIWKPTTGKIYFEDEEVHRFSQKESAEYRIRKVGFIFQDYNLISSLNVKENIELPMYLEGTLSKKERNERVNFLLEKFGISRYKKSYPSELSGGEQQRVAIAIALANNPPLILADEPTANLDAANREIVLDTLESLRDAGTTVIIATHDPEVEKHSDFILKLDKGRMVE